ncbi:MAG TPA: hypothetical protein GXX36_02080 [Clostridiaceae bacterium]|nr:hypothetical protein [Clostridiaceae bacterium]
MNCEQAELFMMKFFDGEYNELEYAIFEEHLKDCEKCALNFANMKEVLSAVETDAMMDPPENFETEVMEKVRRVKSAKRQKPAQWVVIAYKAAAVVSALLLAVFMYGKAGSNISSIMEQMDAYAIPLRGLIQTLLTIIMTLTDGVVDTLQILTLVGTAIVQEYVYILAALILMALGMKKLYTKNE